MPSLKEYKTLIKKIKSMFNKYLRSLKDETYEGDAYVDLIEKNKEFEKLINEEENYNKEIKKEYRAEKSKR
jgi:hypothetical protein